MDTIFVLRRPPYIGRMERDPGPYPLCAGSRDLVAPAESSTHSGGAGPRPVSPFGLATASLGAPGRRTRATSMRAPAVRPQARPGIHRAMRRTSGRNHLAAQGAGTRSQGGHATAPDAALRVAVPRGLDAEA